MRRYLLAGLVLLGIAGCGASTPPSQFPVTVGTCAVFHAGWITFYSTASGKQEGPPIHYRKLESCNSGIPGQLFSAAYYYRDLNGVNKEADVPVIVYLPWAGEKEKTVYVNDTTDFVLREGS
jgi:hypothetical protein